MVSVLPPSRQSARSSWVAPAPPALLMPSSSTEAGPIASQGDQVVSAELPDVSLVVGTSPHVWDSRLVASQGEPVWSPATLAGFSPHQYLSPHCDSS